MPRLSMWRENHSNDYKFFDRRISEEFTIGGTGVLLHKYLGVNAQANAYPLTSNVSANTSVLSFSNVAGFAVGQTVQGINIQANTVVTNSNVTANTISINTTTTGPIAAGTPMSVYWTDYTKPNYVNDSLTNIQDLLFLENRDRKYDTSVYTLRGIYTVNDNDFDLQQFGIFLSADTIMITFHLNDTVSTVGRKIMAGDVVELQHKKDYYPLNAELPALLKRYYVVQDVTFAAEGFSQTWWPHLLRVKLTPLVDSQEYKDILNQLIDTNNDGEPDTPLGDLISTRDKLLDINDAVIRQAQVDVPSSGYNTSRLYIEPLTPTGAPGDPLGTYVDNTHLHVSSNSPTVDAAPVTPDTNVPAYLGGDGYAPNGWPVTASTSFPSSPRVGDYVLRTDYLPNRLFRFDGKRWIKIEDNVRTDLTPGPNNLTQRSIFVNDTATFTNIEGQTVPVRQSLSKALTPKADN